MKKQILVAAVLLITTPAFAQMGPPSGGGGAGGGGPPSGGGPGGPGGGGPREVSPIKRAKFDKAVTAMFRNADTNGDGTVTLEEVNAVVGARRDKIIGERFGRVDTNRDGMVSQEEFFGWQRTMGSATMTEATQSVESYGPISDAIGPDLGDDIDDRMLGRLIEPINGVVIGKANSNYDGGMSLEELMAYEGQRFDKADADKDDAVSMEEMRTLIGGPRGPGGRGFGGPGGGMGGQPPSGGFPGGSGGNSGSTPAGPAVLRLWDYGATARCPPILSGRLFHIALRIIRRLPQGRPHPRLRTDTAFK